MNTEQLQDDVGYLLGHVSAILAKQADQVLQERLGIGLSQLRILRVLHANPHSKQRAIADVLGQTEASVSRQVRLLLEDGLLHVSINPKSRREHRMLPTAKGEQLTEAALRVLAKHHHATFSSLSEKQRVAFASALEIVHAQLCISHDSSKNFEILHAQNPTD